MGQPAEKTGVPRFKVEKSPPNRPNNMYTIMRTRESWTEIESLTLD